MGHSLVNLLLVIAQNSVVADDVCVRLRIASTRECQDESSSFQQ
jgi:hypothetical protein